MGRARIGIYSCEASIALTIERHNVNILLEFRSTARDKSDVAFVALLLATKTNIRRSVKCDQPWLVMRW